ncbi:uncharacterized protein [Lepeophtheirus salmonis]|nr:delta-like protein C [Lepeophtheirus salmonis]
MLIFIRYILFVTNFLIGLNVKALDPCSIDEMETLGHYRCDKIGNIICVNGYKNPDNLCNEPSCIAYNGKEFRDCVHGNCTSPGVCHCEIGWRGPFCDVCVRFPGCQHGTCDKPYQCNCQPGYAGVLCNEVECPESCENGVCVRPNVCFCEPGWKGKNCNECITPKHCEHGRCITNPFECVCDEGWGDLGCSRAICKKGCNNEHGFCITPDKCLCFKDWEGENCEEYVGSNAFF